MKEKREIIILVALIALVSLYIILRDDKQINYTLPQVESVNTEDINKITYTADGSVKTFVKKTDGWYLEDKNYLVEKFIMDDMVTSIGDFKLVDMISDSENYDRFDLDNPGIIKAFKGEQVLREIHTGTLSSTKNYTYVRVPGRKEVYSARGNLVESFQKDAETLRSKAVLEFTDATEVEYVIDETVQTKSAEELPHLIESLQNLVCRSWEDGPKEKEVIRFKITADGKEHTLTIYEKTDKGYPAISSYTKDPFILPDWKVDELIQGLL